MQKKCSICKRMTDTENASILTIGGFGTLKYMCDECDADFGEATESREPDVIAAAMARINRKMTAADVEDRTVIETVEEIMNDAAARAEAIKEGTYDFSEEEEREEAEDGVPEELRESEEDREADRIEAERNAKIDKVMNWVSLAVILAVVGFVVYRIISIYF